MKPDHYLSPKALVYVHGSSKGTQPKYFDNGFWYKVNQLGYEGNAEFLVSKILECSNVKDFVKYEEYTINGRSGCRSKNFLQDKDSFLSFQRLYEIYEGGNLTDRIRRISEVTDRIDFTVNFVKEHTGVDCREYLARVLTLDMLILNTDRHFNNLGVVINEIDNTYRPAPIFDNGNSLLSDWDRFCEDSLDENIVRVTGQPFSVNLEYQAHMAGIGLKIDYPRLKTEIDGLPEDSYSRGLTVLKYQLDRYINVIPTLESLKTRDIDTWGHRKSKDDDWER